MKNHFYYIKLLLLMFCIGGAVTACKDHDEEKDSEKPELTIFFHQPYSDLVSYLDKDLREVNTALLNAPELCNKLNILYFRNDEITGKLYKKEYRKDKTTGDAYIEDVLIAKYPLSQTDYTTFTGLHQILSDVISVGKTDKYGMVIGCHGTGWLNTKEDKSSRAFNDMNVGTNTASGIDSQSKRKVFGITNNDKYDTSYKTLGKAIEATGKKFEFLLVDDCYSQNIEVAYDLRNACNFIIASVTEMGGNGQNYETAIPHLFVGNYKAICDDNITFYTQPGNLWGTSTISVVDCSQVDGMASVMKDIYKNSDPTTVQRSDIQILDGYDHRLIVGYNVFYDFADYVHNLCTDAALKEAFDAQMKKLVVYNVHTPVFNSVYFNNTYAANKYLRPIRTCCGITCSDPCTEKQAEWKETSWYIATH